MANFAGLEPAMALNGNRDLAIGDAGSVGNELS
jgi:hypothetical protein